jgi:pimeloyl-ACP methyl ester carboxylesterase
MAMLRINATARGLRVHGSPQSVNATLAQAASGRGPVTIMVHGYKYSPFVAGHCPHQLIFHVDGWPSQLQSERDGGLCIALGWHARGGLVAAYDTALGQAAQLAKLIAGLRGRRPVHIIAHSLGATLTLAALPYLQAGDVDRIVLLSGAAHLGLANHALATPAGAGCEMFHVTSSSNALFDFVFERMIQGSGAIGRGLEHNNAMTLQIDCPDTLAQLATLGYPVAPAQRRICHWSCYTRAGVMALNAALLNGALDLDTLRQALPTVLLPAQTDKTNIMEGESFGEGPQHEQLH